MKWGDARYPQHVDAGRADGRGPCRIREVGMDLLTVVGISVDLLELVWIFSPEIHGGDLLFGMDPNTRRDGIDGLGLKKKKQRQTNIPKVQSLPPHEINLKP